MHTLPMYLVSQKNIFHNSFCFEDWNSTSQAASFPNWTKPGPYMLFMSQYLYVATISISCLAGKFCQAGPVVPNSRYL